jgi:hypothetical protein
LYSGSCCGELCQLHRMETSARPLAVEHPDSQSALSRVFWIAARIYLLRTLQELTPHSVLLPILLLHGLRHLGLMFLTPGATYSGLLPQFAYPGPWVIS